MKRIFYILIILFLLNCIAVKSYAFEKKGDITLILLDISTSMASTEPDEPNNLSRFQVALKSIDKILKKYEYSDNIGLRTIGISSRQLLEDLANNPDKVSDLIQGSNNSFYTLYKKTCDQSRLLVPISGSSLHRVYDVAASITCDGTSTPIEYSLKQAIEVDFANYPKSVKKQIILITDGYEGCGGNPCKYINELAKSRKDIVIDVISVLPENANFSLYHCITDTTGGNVYKPVIPSESFNSTINFQTIPSTICTNCSGQPSFLKSLNNNIEYKSFLLEFK